MAWIVSRLVAVDLGQAADARDVAGTDARRITHSTLITLLHPCNDLAFSEKHGGNGVLLFSATMIDSAKLAARGPLRELLPNVGIRCFLLCAQYFLWSIGLYGFVLWLPVMISKGSLRALPVC